MKNKGMFIVISSSIIVVLISIIYIFSLRNFDKKLLSNKWYHYDSKTGYSDILFFRDNDLYIYKASDDNKTDDYTYCKNYKYKKSNKKITLDCNKTITLKSIKDNKVLVTINGEEFYYFSSLSESRKYEFKEYFGKTIVEYKNSKKATLDVIKINKTEINNLIKGNDYSKIIFAGSNCSAIECALLNDVVEKWISYSKDVYYINSDELEEKDLTNLYKINSDFKTDINEYNDTYPTVYVVGKGKIIDKYKIICTGLNCSLYYNK